MKKNFLLRFIIIAAVLGVALYFLYPTYKHTTMPPENRKRSVINGRIRDAVDHIDTEVPIFKDYPHNRGALTALDRVSRLVRNRLRRDPSSLPQPLVRYFSREELPRIDELHQKVVKQEDLFRREMNYLDRLIQEAVQKKERIPNNRVKEKKQAVAELDRLGNYKELFKNGILSLNRYQQISIPEGWVKRKEEDALIKRLYLCLSKSTYALSQYMTEAAARFDLYISDSYVSRTIADLDDWPKAVNAPAGEGAQMLVRFFQRNTERIKRRQAMDTVLHQTIIPHLTPYMKREITEKAFSHFRALGELLLNENRDRLELSGLSQDIKENRKGLKSVNALLETESIKKPHKERLRSAKSFFQHNIQYLLQAEKDKRLLNMFDSKINLGLDLQGGMHIVLEATLSQEDLARYRSEIRTQYKDEEDFDEDRLVREMERKRKGAFTQALSVIRDRVDKFGVAEATVRKEGYNRLTVELPGIKDKKRARELIGRRGMLFLKIVDQEATEKFIADDGKTLKIREDMLDPKYQYIRIMVKNQRTGKKRLKEGIIVERQPEMAGTEIVEANVSTGESGRPEVNFRLSPKGTKIFADVTRENKGERMAIVIDNTASSAPNIETEITDGRPRITGLNTAEEARDIATILRSGALPVQVNIINEESIDATLGNDSVRKGARAVLIAMMLVILFMLFYYKIGGIFADIALVFNLILILAALATLGAALSLAGIAGIVLTVGMAVDANVIIFERIKEELKSGKSNRIAVEAGFDKAWSSIIDANITTLIAAFVLSQFTSGPVAGFAITLFIGILSSLFTALFVTRFFLEFLVTRRWVKKLLI